MYMYIYPVPTTPYHILVEYPALLPVAGYTFSQPTVSHLGANTRKPFR